MSDTDEENTDADDAAEDADDEGFDKEAERERLREKYERDKQRRQATQLMSELLLKGATMTNQHCDSCGSPLFRYDGEVFCPTCQGTRGVVDEDDASAGSEGATTDAEDIDAGAEGDTADETVAGTDSVDGADGPDRLGRVSSTMDESPTDRAVPGRSRGADREPPRGSSAGSGGGPDRESLLDSSRGPSSPGSGVEEAPSLSQAKASLRRAIVSLSEQAAQSDDPGRAHALLEGTREAAEALAALGGDKE